jgi:23S rRNA (guanosine2251-2'-O)-methyltransferase
MEYKNNRERRPYTRPADSRTPKRDEGLIFGLRAVIEAIEAGKEIDRVVMRRDLQGDLSRELNEALRANGISPQRVPKEALDRITRKNHQGVVAFISPVVYRHLEEIVPKLYEDGKTPLIVALDGITDVRNFGAIARTCECAGVDAIVIPSRNSVSVTADAVKTSAGALLNIPVCKERNIREALQFLKDSGYQAVAATEKADNDYYATDFTLPTVIVLGGEDEGISAENLRLCSETVKIPILGHIASLNVSAATAVIVYEAVRQRQN